MHIASSLTVAASLLVAMVAANCNQDNCYRALEYYQQTSSANFCKQYLKTQYAYPFLPITNQSTDPPLLQHQNSTKRHRNLRAPAKPPQSPHLPTPHPNPPFPQRISSACSCLTTTTTTPPPVTTTSTFDTSTCTPQSIAACPTAYDPCCAYICAEAQVPFDVCSPNNRTVLASCSQCKYPATTTASTSKKTTTATTKTTLKSTTKPPVTTTGPSTFPFPTSTCTGRLLSTAGCPTPYDHCCQYVCAEAQVPFDVCSLTNGSGEFATCTSCPSPTPT